MGIEDFIKDALYKPNDYIAYHVGRELAELHPGKAIIEGDTGSFDLEAFARAKKCSLVHETSLFNHIKTDWMGPGKRPQRSNVLDAAACRRPEKDPSDRWPRPVSGGTGGHCVRRTASGSLVPLEAAASSGGGARSAIGRASRLA